MGTVLSDAARSQTWPGEDEQRATRWGSMLRKGQARPGGVSGVERRALSGSGLGSCFRPSAKSDIALK